MSNYTTNLIEKHKKILNKSIQFQELSDFVNENIKLLDAVFERTEEFSEPENIGN